MVKVGVIGVGSMGKNHVRIYSEMPNVDLIGVSDVNKSDADKIATQYNTTAYYDYRDLLKQGPDCINIVVPTVYHLDVAKDVLNAGVDTFVEKPITDTVEKAEEMIDLASKNSVKLMIGHIERFNPAVIKLKEIINEGILGNILTISAKRVGPFQPRIMDVSVLVDCCIHDIDIARFITDEEPKRVYAKLKVVRNKHGDSSVVMLVFDSTCAVLEANWFTPRQIRKLFVTGTDGIAELDYISQELFVEDSELKMIPKIENAEPLKLELVHFIECIEKNEEPLITGEDGLRNLKIAIKAEVFSKTGGYGHD